MIDMRLDFAEGGTKFVTDDTCVIRGFEAVCQSALVCTGTNQGSDPVFPLRGTNLLGRALKGAMFNTASREHEANFASLDVLLFFLEEDDQAVPTDRITRYSLEVTGFSEGRVRLNASFESSGGQTIGATLNTTTQDNV